LSENYPVKKNIPLDKTTSDIHLPESVKLIFTSVLVGIGTGLGAVLLNWLIQKISDFSYTQVASSLSRIAPFHYILILGIGGLITGLIIQFSSTEIKGGGIPEVMEAVALHKSRIPPIVAIGKTLATSICIGTGGSAGSEGPIAQIGASLGSSVGQIFHLPEKRIRTLVACGAGAGTAAAFNAPIAGSIFAIELILDNISSVNFSAIVITSVVSSTIARLMRGNAFFFNIPDYPTSHPLELVLFAALGILAALFSCAFCRFRYFVEDIFNKIPIPKYLLPALGGIIVGMIGIFSYKLDGIPRIFGLGYKTINESLTIGLTLKMSFILLLIKMLATSLTVGTGNSGGIFAPSLFMGAMLGQCYGTIVNQIFPNITAPASAYALVGMAAFFSGAVRAPITSILIIFEMTGNYNLVLPLMLATVASSLFSKRLGEDTIYTARLTRKGINLKNIRITANQLNQ
jgi:chloride channel protein, CIC family